MTNCHDILSDIDIDPADGTSANMNYSINVTDTFGLNATYPRRPLSQQQHSEVQIASYAVDAATRLDQDSVGATSRITASYWSSFPALNVNRHNDEVAGDKVYSNVITWGGFTLAQLPSEPNKIAVRFAGLAKNIGHSITFLLWNKETQSFISTHESR